MTTKINIHDAEFCPHLKEVCPECGVDCREHNDAFFGLEAIDREGIEAPAIAAEGEYRCKKHSNQGCSDCFEWKKHITRAHLAARKAGKK